MLTLYLHPVAFYTSSTPSPGATSVSIISRVYLSHSNTAMSVIAMSTTYSPVSGSVHSSRNL